MKSAYELAMEKLSKQNPQPAGRLTDAQKKQLAEIDSLYQSKIAEKELFLNPKIEQARFQGDAAAVASLEKQLRDEKQSLREEMEGKKEKVRHGLA